MSTSEVITSAGPGNGAPVVQGAPGLAPVSVETRKLMDASISPATRRVYSLALRQLETWLQGQGLTDTLLADYLSERHAGGAAPASAAQVVQALRFQAKLHGAAAMVGPVTERTLAGIRRAGKDRGRGQVQGVQYLDVIKLALSCEHEDTLCAARDEALMRTMSDGLLRIGEAVAIDVEHLDFEQDGTGRLTIPTSKTDQEGKGAVLFLGRPTVGALKLYMQRAGITQGALFRSMRRGDHMRADRISVRGVRDLIRARARACGIEGNVSGHSFRVGTAQDLAASGASLVELQQAGRWQGSDMPARYTRHQAAGRGAVARHRYQVQGQ